MSNRKINGRNVQNNTSKNQNRNRNQNGSGIQNTTSQTQNRNNNCDDECKKIIGMVEMNVKNTNFLGKCSQQIKNHAKLHKQINDKQTFVKAREEYTKNKIKYIKYSSDEVMKTTPFWKFAHENVDKIPARYNGKMIIITPNNSTEYKELQKNKDGKLTKNHQCSKAKMNASHIMVIPRTPIWNALSLEPKHIPLLESMMNYGKKYIEDKEKENNSVRSINGDIRYSFHVHPNNTVPYLHMHVWKDNKNPVIRSMNYKNLDVKVVLQVLKESVNFNTLAKMNTNTRRVIYNKLGNNDKNRIKEQAKSKTGYENNVVKNQLGLRVINKLLT